MRQALLDAITTPDQGGAQALLDGLKIGGANWYLNIYADGVEIAVWPQDYWGWETNAVSLPDAISAVSGMPGIALFWAFAWHTGGDPSRRTPETRFYRVFFSREERDVWAEEWLIRKELEALIPTLQREVGRVWVDRKKRFPHAFMFTKLPVPFWQDWSAEACLEQAIRNLRALGWPVDRFAITVDEKHNVSLLSTDTRLGEMR